jgi:hypothetical protein
MIWIAAPVLTFASVWMLIAIAVLMLLVGICCDVVFVALTRTMLRWCEQLGALYQCIVLFTGNVVLGVGLFVGPALVVGFPLDLDFADHPRSGFALVATLSNSLDCVVSIFLMVIALLLLVHRLFWPVASRLLYAVTPTKVRKGLLIAVGSILLTVVFGKELPEWLKEFSHVF